MRSSSITLLAALALPLLIFSRRALRRRRRAHKVPRNEERVLVLGGSSGIGRAIAREYAARGARVCIVARREHELLRVVQECAALQAAASKQADPGDKRVYSVTADFTNVEDVVHVRTSVHTNWQGVDTVVVCAGQSALLPVMETAGLTRTRTTFTPPETSAEAIQRTLDVATQLTSVNFFGPLVSAVAFLPLLQASSASPSVLLVSSIAALTSPPTRSFYAATKAASLVFYQALAFEHPLVAFSMAIPATVQGKFRASAVDGIPKGQGLEEQDGLSQEAVARRCVRAVDGGERHFFMPWWFGRAAQVLFWVLPQFVEWFTKRKYHFHE